MSNVQFYAHVSNWLKSLNNPDRINAIRDFIDKAVQPSEVKQQLYREADYREAILRKEPLFTYTDKEVSYLTGEDGAAMVYTSRFSAVCKLATLALKGYDVELEQTNKQYRIKLITNQ